jgi:hypothetical protein
MVTKEEFSDRYVSDVIARLMPSALDGVYCLYPEPDNNIITEPEIYAIQRAGYRFIFVSVNKGKVRALFEKSD